MTQQPAADAFPPAPVTSAQPVSDPTVPSGVPSPVPPAPGVTPPPPGPVPPPPPSGRWQPERVVPVPGTEFGLIQLRVVPITSGLAIGSLVAGIAAILVSFLVLCFGLTG